MNHFILTNSCTKSLISSEINLNVLMKSKMLQIDGIKIRKNEYNSHKSVGLVPKLIFQKLFMWKIDIFEFLLKWIKLDKKIIFPCMHREALIFHMTSTYHQKKSGSFFPLTEANLTGTVKMWFFFSYLLTFQGV